MTQYPKMLKSKLVVSFIYTPKVLHFAKKLSHYQKKMSRPQLVLMFPDNNRKKQILDSSKSQENFMVWFSSWSWIILTYVHISGCQCGSLSSCWQSSDRIRGGREIISGSQLTHSNVWLCVCGKIIVLLFSYHCIVSTSALFELQAHLLPNTVVWLVRKIEKLSFSGKKCCKFILRNYEVQKLFWSHKF